MRFFFQLHVMDSSCGNIHYRCYIYFQLHVMDSIYHIVMWRCTEYNLSTPCNGFAPYTQTKRRAP